MRFQVSWASLAAKVRTQDRPKVETEHFQALEKPDLRPKKRPLGSSLKLNLTAGTLFW